MTFDRVRIMVFNATFNNFSVILWQSVLLMEETRVPGENHRPVSSHWQTLSSNVVSSTCRHELTTLVVIDTDCTGSCKSIYYAIMTMTAPSVFSDKLKNIYWREKETQGNIICSYFLTTWHKITKTGLTSGLVSVH